nr:phytanoyl-CoA hydroxylase-interacting protein-like isoform X2 [Crassostrea virginica]XP_022336347.1 phytanoyl-CoA hydroxylase-interacting protein-like isoform X2 [Crassostrea virginica]XP_022336348.1 phytanoyl-CoA hydroxylase-interacting protein-like isoform X2 [Crassostrea virginica]
MLVRTKEDTAREWCKSVIVVTHRSCERGMMVILDTKNQQRATVEFPDNPEKPTTIKDFFIKMYGVDAMEKVVDECSTDYIESKLREDMETIEVWKREIPIGKYTLKINSESKDRILLITEVATDEKHLLQCQSEGGTMVYEIPFPLKPASDYVVQAFYGSCLGPGKYSLSAHAHFEFRTAMLQKHVQLLYNRASEFCRPARRCAIYHLYRNKPRHYFEKIRSRGGVMTKYLKNNGGDQASPLNRSIQGLFFSAHYKYSPDGWPYLPERSPFGDQRLHVALPFFVNANTNLYFADFFCHYKNHHVTLVITKAGSYSDQFCKKHLIPVDKRNNPFLYYNHWQNTCFTNVALNIEIFYTDNIDIGYLIYHDYAYFSFCKVIGNSKGKSFIGQMKNKECQKCNLTSEEIIEPVLI